MNKYRNTIHQISLKQGVRLIFPCSEAEMSVGADRLRARPLNSNANFFCVRRTQSVPLFSRLFNRGNVARAARIWCASAKRGTARNVCALSREELFRFVRALRAQPKKDQSSSMIAGPKAGELAGQKSPDPQHQVLESHGYFVVKKNCEEICAACGAGCACCMPKFANRCGLPALR